MFIRVKMLLAAVFIASVALADTVRLSPDAPERYVVVKGDTLWDISGMFLENPWQWPEIWALNQQIDNPHLIYPGDELALVWVDGQQRITTIRRGEAGNTLRLRPGQSSGGDGTIELQPSVRVEPIENAIPAIERQRIQAFLNGNRIIDPGIMARAGYVISGDEGRTLLGEGDRFYARGLWDNDNPTYEVFRPGRVIVDVETGDVLGFEAVALGEASLERVQGPIGTFDVLRSFEDIGPDDRLLALPPERLQPVFYPSAPSQRLEGRVVHVPSGVEYAGQYDVIMINRGEAHGLEPGNVMELWRRGQEVTDPRSGDKIRLPGESAGTGMIFRTFEQLSYVLIMESKSPIKLGDAVSDPR